MTFTRHVKAPARCWPSASRASHLCPPVTCRRLGFQSHLSPDCHIQGPSTERPGYREAPCVLSPRPSDPDKLFTALCTKDPTVTTAAFYNSCVFLPGARADFYDTKSDLSPREDKKHIQGGKKKKNSGTEAAVAASGLERDSAVPGGALCHSARGPCAG